MELAEKLLSATTLQSTRSSPLREGRIKGGSWGREQEDRLKLLKLDQESRQLHQESRQLQQQVSVVRSRYSQYCQLYSE